jgi:hypothetical protein
MTHVLHFVENTTSDLRGGRQSWRVLTTLCAGAFVITVAARLIVHF